MRSTGPTNFPRPLSDWASTTPALVYGRVFVSLRRLEPKFHDRKSPADGCPRRRTVRFRSWRDSLQLGARQYDHDLQTSGQALCDHSSRASCRRRAAQAVLAAFSPSLSSTFLRMRNFCALPVTVIGKESTNST